MVVKGSECLKPKTENVVLNFINETFFFVVDTSDYSITATLNQAYRPVAFISRTLNACEQKLSAIEKEVCAIMEVLHKWRHYLNGH